MLLGWLEERLQLRPKSIIVICLCSSMRMFSHFRSLRRKRGELLKGFLGGNDNNQSIDNELIKM